MRAIAMIDYDSGVALHELPAPRPAPNELLVRVRASSVNRIDVLVAGGVLKGMMEYEFPAVPGRDFAGTVEQVGADVGRFEVGDDVFGFLTKPTVHEGGSGSARRRRCRSPASPRSSRSTRSTHMRVTRC